MLTVSAYTINVLHGSSSGVKLFVIMLVMMIMTARDHKVDEVALLSVLIQIYD